jgi:serine/threonine-protein kinase RsbW
MSVVRYSNSGTVAHFGSPNYNQWATGVRVANKIMAGDSAADQFPECDFDPDKLKLRVRVTLAADRKSVDPVVQQVMHAVREMKCVNGKEDAIELSLQEALANAVVHGAKEDPTKVVECIVVCDEQRGILIIVRDPGEGFDPQAIPTCTFGENLYSNHGRGIFLINQLMDEVRFHKNGTEIHMVKR